MSRPARPVFSTTSSSTRRGLNSSGTVAARSRDRLFRRVLFEIFPHPNRLRALAGPLWLYQRSGLQRLMRVTGLLTLLPARLHAMDALLPSISLRAARSQLPERWPAQGPRRRRVGLLLGCVQRIFFADVNAATARVLAAEGCDVIIPSEQGCCGAILTHSGREEEATAMARRLIDAWERAHVDTVVVNAAGCGAALKEYGHLLRDDPQYAERAHRLAAKCRDVAEVLAELEPRAPRHPVPLRVAYHDACHLQHAQRVTEQPRRVLRTIPQLEVLDVPESAGLLRLRRDLQPGSAAAGPGARRSQGEPRDLDQRGCPGVEQPRLLASAYE